MTFGKRRQEERINVAKKLDGKMGGICPDDFSPCIRKCICYIMRWCQDDDGITDLRGTRRNDDDPSPHDCWSETDDDWKGLNGCFPCNGVSSSQGYLSWIMHDAWCRQKTICLSSEKVNSLKKMIISMKKKSDITRDCQATVVTVHVDHWSSIQDQEPWNR